MAMQKFYRDCYLKNGWIPAQALTHGLGIGDVFQLDNGAMRPLLNLLEARLVESVLVSEEVPLDPASWSLSHGMEQSYCEARAVVGDNGTAGRVVRQALTFEEPGDYAFHCRDAVARFLVNWSDIAADLILKLTQLHYTFRHAYVVTAVTRAHDWVLAVAAREGAQLETTSHHEEMDWSGQMTHPSSRTEVLSGIFRFEIGRDQPAHFYKARKLRLSDELESRLLQQILENRHRLGTDKLANWLSADKVNLLKANELNLNTAMQSFDWCHMNLDDIAGLAD